MAVEESSKRCAFTFVWHIEKFNFWEKVSPGYVLESPRFNSRILDESVFRLHLFPKGTNERDKNIGLALVPVVRKNPSVRVDCEWSYLGRNGRQRTTGVKKNNRIEEESLLYLSPGPTQLEVFGKGSKVAFVTDRTFNLRCRIWESERDMEEDEEVFGLTRIDIREDSFVWSVKEFSSLQLHQIVTHPVGVNFFPSVQNPLTLNFSLTGESLEDSFVNLEIIIRSLETPLSLCGSIFILDSDKRVVEGSGSEKSFTVSENPQFWNIETSTLRSKLMNKKEECLQDDVLAILFKVFYSRCAGIIVKSSYGHYNTESGMQHSMSISEENSPKELDVSQEDSIEVLLDDFHLMFKNHPFSDFEILSGESSIPVHKSVLSSRSPVFETMFSGDMMEASSESMDIPDIDTETLNRMLIFLYTGTVSNLKLEDAINLYYAADKYEISTLKQECSSVFRSDISVANAGDILTVADKHQDAELISFVHGFIEVNYDDVVLSDEWDVFTLNNPYFAAKLMKDIYKRKIKMTDQ